MSDERHPVVIRQRRNGEWVTIAQQMLSDAEIAEWRAIAERQEAVRKMAAEEAAKEEIIQFLLDRIDPDRKHHDVELWRKLTPHTLLRMAEIYVDHPDHRPEWKRQPPSVRSSSTS